MAAVLKRVGLWTEDRPTLHRLPDIGFPKRWTLAVELVDGNARAGYAEQGNPARILGRRHGTWFAAADSVAAVAEALRRAERALNRPQSQIRSMACIVVVRQDADPDVHFVDPAGEVHVSRRDVFALSLPLGLLGLWESASSPSMVERIHELEYLEHPVPAGTDMEAVLCTPAPDWLRSDDGSSLVARAGSESWTPGAVEDGDPRLVELACSLFHSEFK